ncbi:MAG TPA: permease [Candidatus Methanofastidiosum sp.]|nr:permease [Methanofastidiosum sp.]
MFPNILLLWIAGIAIVLLSHYFDKEKTKQGINKGFKIFKGLFSPFVNIMILASFILIIVPPEIIEQYLGGESGLFGITLSAIIGSITLIPAFIVYPIASELLERGASYMVIATFITTLLMVGVVTYPLESKYFGKKVALVRNALNFFAAIIIGLLIGVIM